MRSRPVLSPVIQMRQATGLIEAEYSRKLDEALLDGKVTPDELAGIRSEAMAAVSSAPFPEAEARNLMLGRASALGKPARAALSDELRQTALEVMRGRIDAAAGSLRRLVEADPELAGAFERLGVARYADEGAVYPVLDFASARLPAGMVEVGADGSRKLSPEFWERFHDVMGADPALILAFATNASLDGAAPLNGGVLEFPGKPG